MRALAGAVLLGALAFWVGTDAVLAGLAAIDAGAVLAALGVGLLTTVCGAARWCLVANRLGVPLSLPVAVADTYRALFVNSVLPAGVLGDVHRAVAHGRADPRGLRAVVLERTAGQLVVVLAALAILLTRPDLLGLLPGTWLVPVALAVAALALCSARVRGALRTIAADARATVLHRGTGPGVAALSLLALAGYLALFVVAARAAGVVAPVGELLPLLVLALLAMALPLNVGGWGPREAVGSVAFGLAGLGAAQGLSTAVVYGVLSTIACLPGLGVVLLRRAAVPAREPVPC
ncbi:lysylphosphatidylglycerol synthase domain-containing protein [Pseudonocardia saturnea]